MKINKFKPLLISLLLVSYQTIALSSDASQPIAIDSRSQSLDLNSDVAIFEGDVYLTQGSLKLRADKVVVNRAKDNSLSLIQAFGRPAKFEQTMDDGKKIFGNALQLRYQVQKSTLTMQKQAELIQEGGNKVEGKTITYNIRQQLLVAESDAKSRVTTILQPQTN